MSWNRRALQELKEPHRELGFQEAWKGVRVTGRAFKGLRSASDSAEIAFKIKGHKKVKQPK